MVQFGRGRGRGTDPAASWARLRTAAAAAHPDERWFGTLAGIVGGMREVGSPVREAILEAAIHDEALGPAFPQIQSGEAIDDDALDRLERCLDVGRVDTRYFRALLYERLPTDLERRFADVVVALSRADGGTTIAVEILEAQIRLVGSIPDERLAEEYVRAARQVLTSVRFDEEGQERGYALSRLAKRCAGNADGLETAQRMLENFKAAAQDGRHRMWGYEDVLDAILEAQPRAALDAMLGGEEDEVRFNTFGWLRANPIRLVPDDVLFAWVDEDAARRLPLAAR